MAPQGNTLPRTPPSNPRNTEPRNRISCCVYNQENSLVSKSTSKYSSSHWPASPPPPPTPQSAWQCTRPAKICSKTDPHGHNPAKSEHQSHRTTKKQFENHVCSIRMWRCSAADDRWHTSGRHTGQAWRAVGPS